MLTADVDDGLAQQGLAAGAHCSICRGQNPAIPLSLLSD
jgi:hypothetical protein